MGVMSSMDWKTEDSKSSSGNEPYDGLPLREPLKALMEGGACKDLLMDCIICEVEAEKKNEDSSTKCQHLNEMLEKCYEAHSDYYDPIFEPIAVSALKEMEPVVVSALTEIEEALFPTKQGDTKKRDDSEVEARLHEFMEGGSCKESFITAVQECVEKKTGTDDDDFSKCRGDLMMLKKCMDAHSDYYQPILGPVNSCCQRYESLLRSKFNGGD